MNMLEAAEYGDVQALTSLIASGNDVNTRNAGGQTPLRLANSLEAARVLLDAGADINAADHDGLTPLHRAAALTNPFIMELYLRHGANPNSAANNGQTPLLTAVSFGNDHQAAQLLKSGARTDVKNTRGDTPFNHPRGQTVRDVLLFFGALAELEQQAAAGEECHRLRAQGRELIDSVMFEGYQPPPGLQNPSGPQQATEAMMRHEQEMGRRALALGTRLRSLAESTSIKAMFTSVMDDLRQGQPIRPTYMGMPLTEDAQQRLASFVKSLQEESLRQESPRQAAAAATAGGPAPASNLTPGPQTLDLGGGVTLDFVYLPAGSYMRGSPDNEVGREAIKEQLRPETITVPFLMGIVPVTQAQWEAVMGSNPSKFKGPDRPVESASWENAKDFCARLSERTGRAVNLPTEAQWEYACRAGTSTPFFTGTTISSNQANFNGEQVYGNGIPGAYRRETTDVKALAPNAWGLYDMHGNVWEFCDDDYGAHHRTGCWMRGGCWASGPNDLRAAARNGYSHRVGQPGYGMRVVIN